MLDAAFQSDTDLVLNDMAQRPRPPKPREPAFSVWGVVRGAGRSVPAGAAEAIGSAAEVLGGFGQVMAATGTAGAGGMFAGQTEQERRESERQAQRIREEGVDLRSDAGQLFRNVAREYMPDPVTAHGAEVAVAQFGRLATKAVGAALTLGPVAGAALVGAEEGFTEAEKLSAEGVDPATRMQAGAVTGVLTGLGLALPVAGQTVKGTVGLALAGGPASFVGQQAATRAILDNAGYDKLADQYDPWDPVGLTLSTLLPLGFGALAMRGAARARAAAAAEREASNAGAKPEAAPAPAADAPPVARTAVAQAVDEISVDSARVNLLREHIETTRLTPPEDLRGAALHSNAMARALDQMAAGERVDVTDVVGDSQLNFGPMRELLERMSPLYRGIHTADQRDPNGVTFTTDSREVAARYAGESGQVQEIRSNGGQRLDLRDLGSVAKDEKLADMLDAILGRAETDRAMFNLKADTAGNMDVYKLLRDPEAIAALRDAGVSEVAFRQIGADGAEHSTIALLSEPADVRSVGDGLLAEPARPAAEARTPETVRGDGGSVSKATDQRASEQSGGAPVESKAVDVAARELEAVNPDLMVQLDGMDQPVRLADLLAQTRQQLADDLAEVPLIETAAACFVRTGTL